MSRQELVFSPMIHEYSAEALQGFGYTKREAAFLCLAALTSGHFVSRQFNQFAAKEHGSTVMRLILKSQRNRHVRTTVYLGNTQVHHVYSRPFYRIIGDPGNRNRRRRSPRQIKGKLMCLDYVLANPQHTYMFTERQKVNYFTSRGVLRSALPGKIYRSHGGNHQTTRYFIDKLPIYVMPTDPPVACFCYVEAGAQSVAGFRSFLSKYRQLFSEVGHFQVVYVADTERHFPSARRQFSKLLQSFHATGGPQVDPVAISLLEFFRLESLYQRREFSQLDREKLIRLRKARQQFQGPEVDTLFKVFQEAGEGAVIEMMDSRRSSRLRLQGKFSTYLLNHNYDFLGG